MNSKWQKAFEFRLDTHSGVPVYRQLMDQVTAAIAAGSLGSGDQLPTVRQAAVDLAINPNTVTRAYRELEIRGILETQQGTGTFVNRPAEEPNGDDRQRRLEQFAGDCVARAGASGFTLAELLRELIKRQTTEGESV